MLLVVLLLLTSTGNARIPIVSHIDAYVIGDRLQYTAHFDPSLTIYAPDLIGGWAFNLFMDMDQDSRTGYRNGPLGVEYVVRGVDDRANNTLDVLNLSPGFPAGNSGTAAFTWDRYMMQLDIPLAILGNDQGYFNYRLELYDVVPLGGNALATTHELATFHDGHSHVIPEPSTVVLMLAGLGGLFVAVRRFS